MRRLRSCILTAALLVQTVSAAAFTTEAAVDTAGETAEVVETASINLEDHVEVEGENPVWP